MGWTISTIILIILVTIMGIAMRNLLLKNERLEDFISKPIPLTAYQEVLQKYYESPVESFLKKKVCY